MPSPIEMAIEARPRDLGEGFEVRRALPAVQRRMVGPFIFFDQFGPTVLAPGKGLDVRPHPHICLSTITYVFEGEIVHRDSLGIVQTIAPGDVNWMVAGRGIVHSERTGDAQRAIASPLFGIQAWIALPDALEECEPSFVHHPRATLPEVQRDGARLRVIAGELAGERSPVQTSSELFYGELVLDEGASFELAHDEHERGVYVVRGAIEIDDATVSASQLAVLARGGRVTLRATEGAHVMLLGGAPIGTRHIEWNFVASTQARIDRAKDDWRNERFGSVPGETERIPLPDDPQRKVALYP